MIVLVSMGTARVLGLIAVIDAGSDISAIGVGFGVALLIFQAGGTIACCDRSQRRSSRSQRSGSRRSPRAGSSGLPTARR